MIPTEPAARPFTPFFPDSDAVPLPDTTRDEWISTLAWGLQALFADRPDVWVAGETTWFPHRNEDATRVTPDVMAVFGRPKRPGGPYRQSEEGGPAPQVVIEVWSGSARFREWNDRANFYHRHGVEEFYFVEPNPPAQVTGWVVEGGHRHEIPDVWKWVSPRLGIRFETKYGHLNVVRPDGTRFVTYHDVRDQLHAAERRADKLAARLRELGVDPDA